MREVRAGSGYLSVDDPVVVLGAAPGATAVQVQGPWGGGTQEVPIPPPSEEVVVRFAYGSEQSR